MALRISGPGFPVLVACRQHPGPRSTGFPVVDSHWHTRPGPAGHHWHEVLEDVRG